MSDIQSLRTQIDQLDDELAALIHRRAGLAQKIGELKGGAPAYRPEREAEILNRIAGKKGLLPAERLLPVFREIISACRALEQSIRVSYLGPEGTFSEQAVRKHFGRAVEGLATASVDEAFRRCESGTAQFTVVPAENSTEGVVGRTLDLLLATPLRICGEVELRVQQNLLCRTDDLSSIKKIYSHAQSLAQCNAWLSRFLVLGSLDPAPTGKDRTSLVVSAENKPGAVHALLTPLAQHRVSMTRIESRPARSRLWEYMFFIDVEGHQQDKGVSAALAELKARAPYLKVLGSYPIASK
jgi:chorismate mutase/prephenate dehydratase